MRRVAEVIVVLGVFASLFFLAPGSGAMVGRAQVRRTAGFGADSAERDQPLHVIRATSGTRGWRATRAFKMLKLLFAIEAFILKNGHKTSIHRAVHATCKCIRIQGMGTIERSPLTELGVRPAIARTLGARRN